MSYDEGKTWPISKLIYEGNSAYSNLIDLKDNRIGVLYQKDNSKSITLASLDRG